MNDEYSDLYWCDTETTGLGDDKIILEIVLAKAKHFLDPFNVDIVYHGIVHFTDTTLLNDFVLDMHTKNGLLVECANSTKTISDIENDLLKIIPVVEDKELKPILAGSSIGFDHGFISRQMPKVNARLSHRHYDVSSVKLYAESRGMTRIPKAQAHRAKDDILESISHLKICEKELTKILCDKNGMV